MKTAEELEAMFGVTASQIEEWDALATEGRLPGTASGEVTRGPGRPQLYGEDLVSVTFKVPRSQRDAIDRRANSLGESRSEYLRRTTARDLVYIA